MKKVSLYIVFVVLLTNCSSVEKQNALLDTNLSVAQQMEDIDYLERKMKKIQPSLYHFISKEDLSRKFDSVRNTIKTPLKPNEFYFKVSPLLAAIKQGHASMSPLTKAYSNKENKELKKKGLGPVSQFDYKVLDENLYIIKNYSKDSTILTGTEITSIENLKPQDLFSKYRKTFSSDGYNTTFIPYANSMRFGSYLYYELGMKDSLKFDLKYKDSTFSKLIKRLPKKENQQNTVKNDSLAITKAKDSVVNKQSKAEKKIAKAKKKKEAAYKYDYGYDPIKKEYSKTLTFTDLDSTTAVFKIKNFSKGGFKTAYQEVFELLQKKNTPNLVLDLRNNPGGRLNEIHDLYAYLTADSTFQLIEPAIVTKKTSLLQADYLSITPKALYVITIPTYPIYAAILMAKTKKDANGLYRFSMKSSKVKPHKPTYFKGKIYVLINGGSFSAACIIASKLKENKAITFVGEETGGAFNGTVAGRTSMYELPNSKLKTRLWLMEIAATHKTEETGRGVFPDVTIVPTIEDILSDKDPELEWVKMKIAD